MNGAKARLKRFVAILALVAAGSAAGQGYPAKPVRVIVPFSPGGVADSSARVLSDRLGARLGQPVVVENRPGASGNLGSAAVAAAAPDGYTLLLGFDGTMVINPHVYASLPWDTLRDFAPVTKLGDATLILVAHPSVPARNLKELVSLKKPFSYGTAGTGSTPHLAGELLAQRTGIELTHVPYKGGGQALTDLMGGQVHMHFAVVVSALPHVKSGRLKPLAIGGEARFPALPQVPTFTEAGLPGFRLQPWQGIFAPARTPKPIVDRLAAEISRIVMLPDVTERITGWGSQPLVSTPEQFAALTAADFTKFAEIIKAAKIKID